MNKSSRHKKAPVRPGTRASDNVVIDQEENVMSDHSISLHRVIPFEFGRQQVRTLLVDGQPWFVAADVSAALDYRMAADMTRNLDDDERGTQIVRTPSKNQHGEFGSVDQEMLVINESGLYSAILRSRKPEAKRFKKWVTAEVLPAIRKHGRYEDAGKMATLLDEVIGMSELGVIKGVIRDKAQAVPADRRQGFQLAMHNRLHTRFNVPRTELIPARQFEAACNFIAAYSVSGEWLPKVDQASTVDICTWSNIAALINNVEQSWKIMERSRLSHHLSSLGCSAGMEIASFLYDSLGSAAHLKKHCANELDWQGSALA
ncbi:Bro-N domain-containing protein [Pseudomonas sp. PDM18]|uniref:BRO-N domain-containing protein n=1 Tax=Pseudomonas sp. PDM18 TaxID=2769253 RepID=UPI001785B28F|nr:Bro-N domain-containing protein [Pseudomonas sp. PDM18]MBD9675526.1 Bro-N domain-containing protein [Pseudomonas sp. PDM18]